MDLKGKIKAFWNTRRGEAFIAAVIVLLTALAFGSGWLAGSRTFTRPPIIVNCPPSLYQIPR